MGNLFHDDLKKEIDELHRLFPSFKVEDIFTIWFLRAYVTEDIEIAAKSITNGPKDKGVDAVYVDDDARCVFVVQTKYRHKVSTGNESRQDVLGFSNISPILFDVDSNAFKEYMEGADSLVAEKMTEARKRINRGGYRLWFFYVTLGNCAPGLRKEAESIVASCGDYSLMEIIDGRRLEILMRDYLDGVAPPIPSLDLVMESGHGIKVNGILQRYDARSNIESWVFSMKGNAVADLYELGGRRLFARNIRGFLEKTTVNRSMETTLNYEPEHFFYFNNGITILCDEAKKVSFQGKDILRVKNPQIINGQQTTRTLATKLVEAEKASVIVRVIQVPRESGINKDDFDSLVSQIVEGTNWQNSIKPSDLVSNDRRQIELQREFRKKGFLYLRKKESKGEARRSIGSKNYSFIKKEDLARAVAGCDLDPVEARLGIDKLFDEKSYNLIFPTSDPRYYLTRYSALRKVKYCSQGYPQRGYAIWLVLGFLWSKLSPVLTTTSSQEVFIKILERRNWEIENPLQKTINDIFGAALIYFRKNRGKGAKALDPSTFYRNKRGRHKEFIKFWNSGKNTYRRKFEKDFKSFRKALIEASA